jgi:hypothetical protein
MNLHPRRWHYDTVKRSERKPRVNAQSCVGYRVYCGTRGIVLCKSRDVDIVQDVASVFNKRGKDSEGVGEKKGYIYSGSGDFFVQGSTCEFCWLTNTKQHSHHLATAPGTS